MCCHSVACVRSTECKGGQGVSPLSDCATNPMLPGLRLAWRNSRIFAGCSKRGLVRPDLFVHDRQRPLPQKFHPAYETNTEMDCPRCFCPIATRIPVRVR